MLESDPGAFIKLKQRRACGIYYSPPPFTLSYSLLPSTLRPLYPPYSFGSSSHTHSQSHAHSSYLYSPPSSSNVHKWPRSFDLFSSNPITKHSHSHGYTHSNGHSSYLYSPPSRSNVHKRQRSFNLFSSNPTTKHSHSNGHYSDLYSPPSSSNVHKRQRSFNPFSSNTITKHSYLHSHSFYLYPPPSSLKVHKWRQSLRPTSSQQPLRPLQPSATTSTSTRVCQLSTPPYSPQSQQGLSPSLPSTRTRTSAQVGGEPPSVLEGPKVLKTAFRGVAKLRYVILSVTSALLNVSAFSSNTITKVPLVVAATMAFLVVIFHLLASLQPHALESSGHIKRPLMLLVAFLGVSFFATVIVLPSYSWFQTECGPHCESECALMSTVVMEGFASLMIGGWRIRGGNGRLGDQSR